MTCERCEGPPGETGHCHQCHEDFPEGTTLNELVEHLRLYHPDDFGDGPATWPDGGVVMHDDTLEPKDFL